ncbi:unnamed protein product, partial [Rotaria sp. Silwood2]
SYKESAGLFNNKDYYVWYLSLFEDFFIIMKGVHDIFDPHCTVIVLIDLGDVILNIKDDHCHSSKPEKILIRTFKQAVQARGINESTPIPQIFDEEVARIDLSTLSITALPSQREIS